MIDKFLDQPVYPLRFFVKAAPEDRPTLENWMRYGTLKPTEERDSGKWFSCAALLKVEIMHRLRAGGFPPAAAASIADQMVADYRRLADEELTPFLREESAMEESAYLPTYILSQGADGAVTASLTGRKFDSPMLTFPVGVLARLAAAKTIKFLDVMEDEAPKLKAAARAAIERQGTAEK